MQKSDRYWLPGAILTLGLYILVSAAVQDEFGVFFFVMLGALVTWVAGFHRLFQGSRFGTIALASFPAVYICLFVFSLTANFPSAAPWAARLAQVLPIFAYIASVWLILFGFPELLRYAREYPTQNRQK